MESWIVAAVLDKLDIAGIELNVSCPSQPSSCQKLIHTVNTVSSVTKHPIIVKLGVGQPYANICQELDGKVEAFDLINSVSWRMVFHELSPFCKYGYDGGVSGAAIKHHAENALKKVRQAGVFLVAELTVRKT